MPRENSFSDSDGRSLTPDLEEAGDDDVVVAPPAAAPPVASPRQSLGQRPQTPRSPTSHKSPNDTTPKTTFATPTDRFRSVVRKVMAMKRTSTILARRGVGAEPGIDPRRLSASINYGHIKQKCLIEMVDYSSVRSSFGRMTNMEFIKLLEDERASAREPWVKVRWINVGGISWDVISALAIKYDIHPLALEDVLHQRGHARSKADYYHKHLFIRMLCHTVADDDDESIIRHHRSFTDAPRSSSPDPLLPEDIEDEDSYDSTEKKNPFADEEKTVGGSASGSRFSSKRGGTLRNTIRTRMLGKDIDVEGGLGGRPGFASMPLKKSSVDQRNLQLVKEFKRGDRVNVRVSPMCIFLFRDGTVITIHRDSKLGFTQPITERLQQRDTGLRTTADPSLLVESIIDLVVDQALEVVEAYQSKILKLEQNVLLKPSMKTVRRLHILQGDLILHKRTLEPIKTMVYGLRRYDVDRVAALSQVLDPDVKVMGYMSHKSKIYLADVHDHMEYVLSSMDMFANISENLINFTFNLSSYQMNEVMRRLTLATIIFLPLTLLTGYFGMNFENMFSIHHGHSDIVFWIIALPVMAIVVPMFLWSDIGRMWHYMEKKWFQRKVKKSYMTAKKTN